MSSEDFRNTAPHCQNICRHQAKPGLCHRLGKGRVFVLGADALPLHAKQLILPPIRARYFRLRSAVQVVRLMNYRRRCSGWVVLTGFG